MFWLKNKGIAYEFHDYKKLGISEAKLEEWLTQVPYDKLVNRAGTTFKKLTDEEKTHLCNFFTNQQGHARISPALLKWMDERWHRTQDYFFIDHNDESWLVMLSLIKPSMIRKTVELIAA